MCLMYTMTDGGLHVYRRHKLSYRTGHSYGKKYITKYTKLQNDVALRYITLPYLTLHYIYHEHSPYTRERHINDLRPIHSHV